MAEERGIAINVLCPKSALRIWVTNGKCDWVKNCNFVSGCPYQGK